MYGRAAGEKKANQAAQDKNASLAGAGVAAARADSKSSPLYRNEDWDLVDRLKKDPKFDIEKVPEAELCDELRKMTPEQRKKHVKEMLTKRNDLQKKIEDLSAKRHTYIKEEMKKNTSKDD